MRKVCVKECALFNNSKLNFAADVLPRWRWWALSVRNISALALIIKTREIHTLSYYVHYATSSLEFSPSATHKDPFLSAMEMGRVFLSEDEREREPARREIGCALCCIIWESQRHSSSRQMNGYLIASASVSCAYRISRCAHWIICCCSQRPINFHGCTSALRN